MEKEGLLYLTMAMEWIWIDTDLQLFDLNLQILVTAKVVSRLLGLMRWRDDLLLYITACRVVVVSEF